MLIFDTNIWVSYALSPHGKMRGDVQVAIALDDYAFSKDTFRELTEVLLRDKFDPYVSREKRIQFLKVAASGAQWFQAAHQVSDCRDPRDDMFLALALACEADFLVSGDQDLLVLNPYGKTRILTISEWRVTNSES